MSLEITHIFPNGAVAATLSFSFFSGGPKLAEEISQEVEALVTRLVGTANLKPNTVIVKKSKKSGKIKHLICPVCDVKDSIEEVDSSMRWNRLNLNDDGATFTAGLGDSDFQSDGFICTACLSRLDSDEITIKDWV